MHLPVRSTRRLSQVTDNCIPSVKMSSVSLDWVTLVQGAMSYARSYCVFFLGKFSCSIMLYFVILIRSRHGGHLVFDTVAGDVVTKCGFSYLRVSWQRLIFAVWPSSPLHNTSGRQWGLPLMTLGFVKIGLIDLTFLLRTVITGFSLIINTKRCNSSTLHDLRASCQTERLLVCSGRAWRLSRYTITLHRRMKKLVLCIRDGLAVSSRRPLLALTSMFLEHFFFFFSFTSKICLRPTVFQLHFEKKKSFDRFLQLHFDFFRFICAFDPCSSNFVFYFIQKNTPVLVPILSSFATAISEFVLRIHFFVCPGVHSSVCAVGIIFILSQVATCFTAIF